MKNYKDLYSAAENARLNAYAHYSGFKVGAALLCTDGTVYTGCNIENSSYPLTCCAERVAFFKAVSEGKKEFEAIAITGGKESTDSPCFPCGACRQVMSEFCDRDFKIVLKDMILTLGEILPYSFEL